MIKINAALFVAAMCLLAPVKAVTEPVLPFSAEENADGARGAWFIINISGHPRPYEPCRDIPKSVYYSEVKTPQPGDVYWWPEFMALCNPESEDGNDLVTFGGRSSSKDLIRKYGQPPRIFRAEVDRSVKPGEIVVDAFGQRIICRNPNPEPWLEETRKTEPDVHRGLVLLKHLPIQEHENVQPVISIIFEKFPDAPPSLKEYAQRIPGLGKDVFLDATEEKYNGIFCRVHYSSEDVPHKGLTLFRISGEIGIRLMTDSTEVSYSGVEKDFEAFLSSLSVAAAKQ